MLAILIYLLVVAIILGVIWWVLDFIPVPEPLNRLIKVVAVVVGVIVVVMVLLQLVGVPLNLPNP